MRVLKDTRLWVIAGLLSLTALVWIVTDLVSIGTPPQPLPLSFRITLLVILYLTAAGVWLILQMHAKRINSTMLNSLADTKEALANVAAEEKLLKEKFAQAMSVLKTHKFAGKQGNLKLFQLPWYIVIGSPGSGKTTAIANSGLEFPLSSILGTSNLTGTGGTRNCDWWITNNAVLLDTAGRYTTQSSNQTADAIGWNNFLELLRTNRKRQPINGAVFVLSVDEILNYSNEQWQQHLQQIKSRLNELVDKLNQTFPTYLILTKMDLLSGFREFFDTLDAEEQSQVWGATLPVGVDGSKIGEEIALISQRLQEQLPFKLKQERDLRRRQAIFHFPWQFSQLNKRLQDLTNSTFNGGGLVAAHELRGIYFTSAVQQGSPIERLFSSITQKFGISGNLATAARNSRTLFLKQVFQQVIFPESILATTNIQQDKHINLIRTSSMIASIAVGAIATVVWISGYFVHNTNLKQASDRVNTYLTVRQNRYEFTGMFKGLKELESAVAIFDQRQHPLISSLGMYDGAADEAARDAFKRALKTDFLDALAGAIQVDLLASESDYARSYSLLKAYLMLNDLAHREQDYLISTIRGLSSIKNSKDGPALLEHFMVSLAEIEPNYLFENSNQELIDHTRALLTRVTPAERVYWQMQDAYKEPIDLRQELGKSFSEVFAIKDDAVLVKPVFYTRQVYETLDFTEGSDAMSVLLDDDWVLGENGSIAIENRRGIAADVKKLYIRDYMSKWRDVYQNINLTVPHDINAYVNTVSKLADPTGSPLLLLSTMTARETSLPDLKPKDEKIIDTAEKLAAKTNLGKKIKPLLADTQYHDPDLEPLRAAYGSIQRMSQGEAASKNNQIILTLGELRQWISGIYMSSDSGTAALQTLDVTGALDPSKKLLVLASELPQPYGAWVASLARNAQSNVTAKATNAVNQGWKSEVGDPCKEKFSGKFPFSPNSRADSTMAAVTEFFKPGGIEDDYIRQNVKKYLNKPGSSIPSSATRAAIRQAQAIRETLFAQNDGSLGFNYTLTPIKVDQQVLKVSIETAGSFIEYSHGPKLPTELTWPDEGNGIAVTFQLADGRIERKNYPGAWALHHLVYDTKGGASNQVTFKIGLYSATFQTGTKGAINPFNPTLYFNYQCRDSI